MKIMGDSGDSKEEIQADERGGGYYLFSDLGLVLLGLFFLL